jgi:hypothetical protein
MKTMMMETMIMTHTNSLSIHQVIRLKLRIHLRVTVLLKTKEYLFIYNIIIIILFYRDEEVKRRKIIHQSLTDIRRKPKATDHLHSRLSIHQLKEFILTKIPLPTRNSIEIDKIIILVRSIKPSLV